MRLKDKVPIVTGGARGIGLAIARRYAAEGARVTIADVDTAGAAAASAMSNAHFVAAHAGDALAAENVVAETCRAFGDLDIVVNNAGIIHGADFLELEEADFDRVLRVNLKGGVPGRPGRRPPHGRAGQGRRAARQHHQHELDQRGGRDCKSHPLLRGRRAASIN